MTRDQVRLECLKLVYNRTRPAADNVIEAKVYEEYLLSPAPKTDEIRDEAKPKMGRPPLPKRGVDNSDILS